MTRALATTWIVLLLATLTWADVSRVETLAGDIDRTRQRLRTRYVRPLQEENTSAARLDALARHLSRYRVAIHETQYVPIEQSVVIERETMDPAAFEKAFAAAGQNVRGLEIARSLYAAGLYEKARPLFEAAFEQTDERETREWILLLIADCLRRTDPRKAVEAYQGFLTAYPDSSWYAFADFRAKLLAWQAVNLNETILEGRP